MTADSEAMATQEQRLQEVLAAYLREVEAGRNPDQAELLARHPDLAAELHDFFADHQQLGRLAAPLRQAIQQAPDAEQTTDAASETVGSLIAGRYKLLEQIGHGGMGQVWMAEQRAPVKRLVAVKLIKVGMDSRAVLARFEAERQALALMDHANIARVFDGGTTAQGRPYFVMELVKGLPLTTYCDERRLSVPERLELFVQVCSAVQHAHQKGIMHRDLKPSNILVTEYDGRPVPKVIDFGLAKALNASHVLTEHTLHTAFGTMVGTPLYMAPEQVGINALDVDTRTDIYALGVILYELLTGTTPLERKRVKEAAWDEFKRLIREEEPPRPSLRLSSSDALPSLAAQRGTEPTKLSQLVRGDLDWIVLKALEKDRNRRYETANGLAMDVQRYLADEPVLACPPSAGYRFRKFVRRNKVALMTAGVVAAALLIGTAVSVWQAVEANAARNLAAERLKSEEQARREAETHFQKALNAVKRMLIEVGDEQVAAIPQMKETRQRLLDEAVAFYSDLIASNPRHSQAYVERGDLYCRMGKWEQARDDYLKALECDPDNVEALRRRGSAWIMTYVDGDWSALPYLRRALELQPTNPISYLSFATFYGTKGRPKEAATAYRRAAELFPPGSAEAYSSLANAALAEGDHRTARENFEKVLSMAPSNLGAYLGLGRPDAHLGLGRIHVHLGEYDQALAAFTKAVESPRVNSWVLFQSYRERAAIYLRQKKYTAALSDINRTLDFKPYEWYLYKQRGLAHFRLQHYEEALADIAKAVELRPDDGSNLWWIPPEDVISCPDEKFRTGLRALADKTIEILEGKPDASDEQKTKAYRNRAGVYLATGTLDQADRQIREFLQRVRKMDTPKSTQAAANGQALLGHILEKQQQYVAAEPFFREAARLQPDSARYHNNLAWLLATCPDLKLRYPGQAVVHAKKAVELEPGSGNYWNTLGAAQYRNGDWKAAIEALMKSVQLLKGQHESFNFFFLAMAHWQLGEKDKARAWYDQAVAWMDQHAPQDAELKSFRAEATALLGLAKAAQTQNKKD